VRWTCWLSIGVLLGTAAARVTPLAAQTVATIADSTAIIEDLAWDAAGRRFIVSDVHNGRLRTVTLEGIVRDFGRPLAPGWGILGIAVDQSRGIAWATAVTLAQVAGYTSADSGHAALLRIDLRDGHVLKRYDLPAPTRAAPGDLAIAGNHDVIAGDGMTGAVFVIGAGDTLATLVPAGRMRSTQQPVVLPGGRAILIPWYGRGLMRVDRASGDLAGLLAPPSGMSLAGLDGLAWSGRDLIAVYNGRNPNALLRLTLDSALTAVQRVDTIATPAGTDDFNHVAIVDGALYAIVNAGWSKYEDDGRRKAGAYPLPRIVRLTF
jgi:hypothetical protein